LNSLTSIRHRLSSLRHWHTHRCGHRHRHDCWRHHVGVTTLHRRRHILTFLSHMIVVSAAIVVEVAVLTWIIIPLVVLAVISLLITLILLIRITTLWLSLSTSTVRSLTPHLRWRGPKTIHLILILHGMHQKSE